MTGVTFGVGKPTSRMLLLVLIALTGILLGGCVHAKSAVTISKDDKVSGELRVATETPDGKMPFRLTPPPDLADKVQVTPYGTEGRTGSRLQFRDLTFAEVERLGKALSPNDSRFQLHLRRAGSLVIFDGSVDLTPLANTDSSLLVELSAPGETTTTNGKESAGMVSWAPEAGEVTQMSATYQFAGEGAQGWVGWTTLVGVITMGVAALVAVLAQQAHERQRANAGERRL